MKQFNYQNKWSTVDARVDPLETILGGKLIKKTLYNVYVFRSGHGL